ncbi:unnamed protein product [Diatraea saccharalis]|uniref:Hexosyltransferase n=1 Tax=Diatraea saccharalis TaxID=40085 RepID=A0A9N9N101_9NEOP|nr:unnamed protein product [Diatraea saccharalis]
MLILIKRHKSMILVSIFFFYIGCGLTLSFLRLDCVDVVPISTEGELAKPGDIEYAVLVLTGPENEERRNVIRSTWAKFAENIFIENGETLYKWNHTWIGETKKQPLIKVFFAVGIDGLQADKLHKLKLEMHRNDDLILLDLYDSYRMLSTKVLYSMKWFNDHLKGLKYLVKCDDDSFVRIDLIVKDLETFAPEMNGQPLKEYVSFKTVLPSYKGLYWGYFDGRAKTLSKGKWKEKSWFLCDTYLPYALGGGYVISKSIVNYIAQNSDFLSLYNSEDVSMGVWTAALDGINRVHDLRFDSEWKSRGCSENMLVRHKQTSSDMFQMYKSLVNSHGEKLCKTEILNRQSYIYNWNVLPSKCCR